MGTHYQAPKLAVGFYGARKSTRPLRLVGREAILRTETFNSVMIGCIVKPVQEDNGISTEDKAGSGGST